MHTRMLKILVVFCVLLSTSIFGMAEKKVALVVGNSDYRTQTFPYLSTPVNDAKEIGNKLFLLGFDTIMLLNANKEQFIKSITRFDALSQNADVGVFFFSGHATNLSSVNYLVPCEPAFHEAILSEECVRLGIITELMERNCKLSLSFLDACRSEASTSGDRKSIVSPSGFSTKTFTDHLVPIGSQIFFATEDGKSAMTGYGTLSPFTVSLSRHIFDEQEFREVWQYIQEDVMISCGQKPQSSGSYTKDFFFNAEGKIPLVDSENNAWALLPKATYQYLNLVLDSINNSSRAPKYVEAIDLGLHVNMRWANVNVGAPSPEASGDYFAWRENSSKLEYIKKTYKGKDDVPVSSNHSTLNVKYLHDISKEPVDSILFIKYADYPARALWGGLWRLPTIREIEALRDECTWIGCWNKRRFGYKIIGPNGNSIFLPAAGYRDKKNTLYSDELVCYQAVWWLNNHDLEYVLMFPEDNHILKKITIYNGIPIRPVIPNYYICMFTNYDGELLQIDLIEGWPELFDLEENLYNGTPPERTSDDVYSYSFDGWIYNFNSNIVLFTAKFKALPL